MSEKNAIFRILLRFFGKIWAVLERPFYSCPDVKKRDFFGPHGGGYLRAPILHVFLKLFPTRFSERYAGSIFTSPCTVPSAPRRTGRVDFPSLQASRAGREAANATCKPASHEMRCQSRTLWSCIFHRIRSCSGPSCGTPTPRGSHPKQDH